MLDPTDGHVRDRWPWPRAGDSFSQLSIDPAGNVYAWSYADGAQVVLDRAGRLITAVEPTEGVGLAKTISWGNLWWPSPTFLPDGRGFAFGRDGLLEISVTLLH